MTAPQEKNQNQKQERTNKKQTKPESSCPSILRKYFEILVLYI